MFKIIDNVNDKVLDNLKTVDDIPNELDYMKIKRIIEVMEKENLKPDGIDFILDYNFEIRFYLKRFKKFKIYSQFEPMMCIKKQTDKLLYLYSEKWFKNDDKFVMHYFYNIDRDCIVHESVFYGFALMDIEPTEEQKIIAKYMFNKYIKSQKHIRDIKYFE